MKQKFKISKHDYNWKKIYLNEKKELEKIFCDDLDSIHHIGSTAIPNTKTKPEIDILIVVKDNSSLPSFHNSLKNLGYVSRGECLDNGGSPGRFYFSKDVNYIRTHKLHVCQKEHPDIMRFLLFVKYLNDHKDIAIKYSRLKTDLSIKYNYGQNIEKYILGKSEFIENVLVKAFKENKIAVAVEQKRGPLIHFLSAFDFIDIYPVPTAALKKLREAL